MVDSFKKALENFKNIKKSYYFILNEEDWFRYISTPALITWFVKSSNKDDLKKWNQEYYISIAIIDNKTWLYNYVYDLNLEEAIEFITKEKEKLNSLNLDKKNIYPFDIELNPKFSNSSLEELSEQSDLFEENKTEKFEKISISWKITTEICIKEIIKYLSSSKLVDKNDLIGKNWKRQSKQNHIFEWKKVDLREFVNKITNLKISVFSDEVTIYSIIENNSNNLYKKEIITVDDLDKWETAYEESVYLDWPFNIDFDDNKFLNKILKNKIISEYIVDRNIPKNIEDMILQIAHSPWTPKKVETEFKQSFVDFLKDIYSENELIKFKKEDFTNYPIYNNDKDIEEDNDESEEDDDEYDELDKDTKFYFDIQPEEVDEVWTFYNIEFSLKEDYLYPDELWWHNMWKVIWKLNTEIKKYPKELPGIQIAEYEGRENQFEIINMRKDLVEELKNFLQIKMGYKLWTWN